MARGSSPDPTALAGLTAGGAGKLKKAPVVDPVFSNGSPSTPMPVVSAADAPEPVTLPTPAKTPATAAKKKVGFYQYQEDTSRARAAWMRTNPDLGHGSFSDYIAAAVMEKTTGLEQDRNGGKPWPPVGAGVAPTGRPSTR